MIKYARSRATNVFEPILRGDARWLTYIMSSCSLNPLSKFYNSNVVVLLVIKCRENREMSYECRMRLIMVQIKKYDDLKGFDKYLPLDMEEYPEIRFDNQISL